MKRNVIILSTMLLGLGSATSFAQHTNHSYRMLTAGVKTSVPVMFSVNKDINTLDIPAEPIKWGMDVAWNSADNVIRGTNFIGTDILNIGRVSFQPSDLVDADGNLSAAQKATLQSRLDNIYKSGVRNIILNCDHEVLCNKENFPNADTNYKNYYGKPQNWVNVIKASVKYCQSKGFNVITISPFNEPDYTAWNEGTQAHFKEIARLIREDSFFDGIRISAGNTLNCDKALSWYNYVQPYATEGNTHQLAGSMANYTKFWETVRSNGHYATADELHNTMEAFVGIHHGLQSGVWWGWDGACRGEFCKASATGKEIGYAENADTWGGAAVYKRANGRVDAFMGVSERQAKPSTFEMISEDRPVYYDGYGPVYSYTQTITGDPNGTYSSELQKNAERMINICYGEDVPMDPISKGGKFIIMNANSKKVFGYTSSNTNLAQINYSSTSKYAQWTVDPIKENLGGDFGYFFLRSVQNDKMLLDVKDWNTSPDASILVFAGGGGSNEQWFLEYAGDNFWYIRCRHNGLYLDVQRSSTSASASILTAKFTGGKSQKWRFIPVAETSATTGKAELTAPSVPTGLKATPQSASVKLTWNANSDTDLFGYNVLRKVAEKEEWDMIGRMVDTTVFIDNDVADNVSYTYKIKAVDRTRNQSAASEEVTVVGIGDADKSLLARYSFESNTEDASENVLDAAVSSGSYSTNSLFVKEGNASLRLNGTNFLALPPALINRSSMTIAMWVYNGSYSTSWTRIFDFGNGTDQYFFLTPNNGSEMRLVMKDKGDEQILSTTRLTSGWHYIAVTLAPEAVTLYVDGVAKSSSKLTIRPSDFSPKCCYIGRSMFASDPLFTGYIDDLRIYGNALSAEDVTALMNGEDITGVLPVEVHSEKSAPAYSVYGQKIIDTKNYRGVIIRNGKKELKK